MNDLNSDISIVDENYDNSKASTESNQENLCSDNAHTETNSDATVGNDTTGNVKVNVSFPRQRNFDVTV
jgi:hypothetical protein